MWRVILKTVGLLFNVAAFIVEAIIWRCYVLITLGVTLADYFAARRALTPDGKLKCPQGHVFEIEYIRCRCDACRFEYFGSPLRCENPECKAPSAPFVNCTECGLSVRNPHRWGRI